MFSVWLVVGRWFRLMLVWCRLKLLNMMLVWLWFCVG